MFVLDILKRGFHPDATQAKNFRISEFTREIIELKFDLIFIISCITSKNVLKFGLLI